MLHLLCNQTATPLMMKLMTNQPVGPLFRPLSFLTWLLAFALLASGCAKLPKAPEVPRVITLPAAETGSLAQVSERLRHQLPTGESAFKLLIDAEDALIYRLALIESATSSIDIQSFIWQADETGALLMKLLLDAANRGVRVRLLVDDFPLAVTDHQVTALTRHPQIDIKIFNPGRVRDSTLGYYGDFLLYFRELNRRMHNKLFIVDGHAAIVGGRNLGNPYFGLSAKYNFRDLDVLTLGPVIVEISRAFDDFWNHPLAYPGSAMTSNSNDSHLLELREKIGQFLRNQSELLASYQSPAEGWDKLLHQLPAQLATGPAHFLQDAPEQRPNELRLADMLDLLAEPSHQELLVFTPYLIPVGGFLDDLRQLSQEGVKVKILTGSLGSNNHTAAHSHYKKYRRLLLATGAELYEFKHDPSPAVRQQADVPPVRAEFISLHSKALVGDRQRCFVGSLNLDPRALLLNTENGLYVDSADLCGELAADFDQLTAADNAWRVTINQRKLLVWEAGEERVTMQPARGFWQRIVDAFFRILPLESQL